jgi:phosphate starvation-inducible membrane PsiE
MEALIQLILYVYIYFKLKCIIIDYFTKNNALL